MDHVEIWDKAKALLREELANVSYTTWIDQPRGTRARRTCCWIIRRNA